TISFLLHLFHLVEGDWLRRRDRDSRLARERSLHHARVSYRVVAPSRPNSLERSERIKARAGDLAQPPAADPLIRPAGTFSPRGEGDGVWLRVVRQTGMSAPPRRDGCGAADIPVCRRAPSNPRGTGHSLISSQRSYGPEFMLDFTHDGLRFSYRDEGQGLPFVFQHGLGGDLSQPFSLYRPPPGIRLLGFDARGHGQTR